MCGCAKPEDAAGAADTAPTPEADDSKKISFIIHSSFKFIYIYIYFFGRFSRFKFVFYQTIYCYLPCELSPLSATNLCSVRGMVEYTPCSTSLLPTQEETRYS